MLFLVVSSKLLATDHDGVIGGVDNSSSNAPVSDLRSPSAEEIGQLRLLLQRAGNSSDPPVPPANTIGDPLPLSAEEIGQLRAVNQRVRNIQRAGNSSDPPVPPANTIGDPLPLSAEEIRELCMINNLRQSIASSRSSRMIYNYPTEPTENASEPYVGTRLLGDGDALPPYDSIVADPPPPYDGIVADAAEEQLEQGIRELEQGIRELQQDIRELQQGIELVDRVTELVGRGGLGNGDSVASSDSSGPVGGCGGALGGDGGAPPPYDGIVASNASSGGSSSSDISDDSSSIASSNSSVPGGDGGPGDGPGGDGGPGGVPGGDGGPGDGPGGDGGPGGVPGGGGAPNPTPAQNPTQFWDGNRTIADGTILGGSGVWNNTSATWSSPDGLSKNTWNGNWAIFGGNAGTVDVQDNVSFRNMDFIADGYTIHSSNNSKLLTNEAATIGVDSTYQAEISAEITGNGSISKRGLGTLILSHDNSYIGGTVLNEGTLVANTPNALSSGLVTLQAGVLCLGNTRTLQVGSYTQNKDAALVLRANSPTDYDQLVVNGNANLGGTLLLEGKPSSFRKGMPLITSQGLNGSRFDNIQRELAQPSLKMLSVNYDTNNVYADWYFKAIYPYAISRNAKALARKLDLFSNTDRNEELFNSLADLSLEQVPTALEKLVPSQVFALSSIGLSVSRSQTHSLQGRLEALNSGYARQPEASVPQERWGFYIHGNGGFGRQRQDNENKVVGYDYGQGGTFIGADYHLGSKVYVGGAFSYTYTDTSFRGDRGSLSADSYFGHVYTAYAQPEGLNLISGVGFGAHDFDLKRRALIDTAHSKPQGREIDLQTQVSYNIRLNPSFTVSPYAGLAYSAFWIDGFQEHNSQANLKIGDDQISSLRSTGGVKARYEKPFSKGIQKASIEANLAWEREYLDTRTRGFNAEWVGSRVPAFRVQGSRIGADRAVSGVNLRLSITNLLSVTAGYNIAANQDDVSHGFGVGVNLAF